MFIKNFWYLTIFLADIAASKCCKLLDQTDKGFKWMFFDITKVFVEIVSENVRYIMRISNYFVQSQKILENQSSYNNIQNSTAMLKVL